MSESANNKTIGYIRVSTKRQKNEGDSIDAQKARIEQYCMLRGLELIGFLEDSATGKSIVARPAMQELIALCKSGQVQAFVCCRLDRMFRNVVDGVTTADMFDKMGVDMHIMDMGDGVMGNIQTAMGRMIFINALNFAEFEGRRLGERVKEVVNHKRKAGEQHTAVAPFGFKFVRGKRVDVPTELDALSLIWRLSVVKKLGSTAVAKYMSQSIYKTRTGNKRWAKSTIHAILKNPIYKDLFAMFAECGLENHQQQHGADDTASAPQESMEKKRGE